MIFVYFPLNVASLSSGSYKGAAIKCMTPRIYATKQEMYDCHCSKCIGQVMFVVDEMPDLNEYTYIGLVEGLPLFAVRPTTPAIDIPVKPPVINPPVAANQLLLELDRSSVKGGALYARGALLYETEAELMNDSWSFEVVQVGYAADKVELTGVWEYRFVGFFWIKEFLLFIP